MPTVLRLNGFRFAIYQPDTRNQEGEHGPAHVHVIKAGKEVVFNLDTITVRRLNDMAPADVRAAKRLVAENYETLLEAWEKYNG